MKVLHSRLLTGFPGIRHGTATLVDQPLTFRGANLRDVQMARQRFLRRLHLPLESLTLARQVHGTTVRVIDDEQRGSGAKHPKTYLAPADALITQRPGITLGVFTADCIPLVLYDPVTGWIGTVHAGWKGIVRGIIPKTLQTLHSQGVHPADIRAWLGPCICVQCYTTQVLSRVRGFKKILGKQPGLDLHGYAHLDLRAAAKKQLRASGVTLKNIEASALCTKTTRTLPSARRQGPAHPNTLTVIQRDTVAGDLRGKRVVVFGLGTLGGGVASVQYAAAKKAHVTVVDAQSASGLQESLRTIGTLPIDVRLRFPAGKQLPKADMVIANPGISPNSPALRGAHRAGIRVTSDLALFRGASTNPVIAITGTKGKTTVATWIAHLLGGNVVLAGNLQRSPLLIPRAFDGKTRVVLEVSSFQLEHSDVPLRPKLGIITNLYPDHLNRHGTMRSYAKVKASLLEGTAGPSILPLDSEWLRYAPKSRSTNVFWTSLTQHSRAHAWVQDNWIMLRQGKRAIRVISLAQLKNADLATQRNAVTVALAGQLLGLPVSKIRRGLRTFPGVPQRFETVRIFKKRTFINCTTATNPISAALAIQSVHGPAIGIVGGTNKALAMQKLAKVLQQHKVQVILLAGTASTELLRFLPKTTPVAHSMAQAVRMAWKLSKPGVSIILAPGAASFGMFKNEFDRGEQYIRIVTSLR